MLSDQVVGCGLDVRLVDLDLLEVGKRHANNARLVDPNRAPLFRFIPSLRREALKDLAQQGLDRRIAVGDVGLVQGQDREGGLPVGHRLRTALQKLNAPGNRRVGLFALSLRIGTRG